MISNHSLKSPPNPDSPSVVQQRRSKGLRRSLLLLMLPVGLLVSGVSKTKNALADVGFPTATPTPIPCGKWVHAGWKVVPEANLALPENSFRDPNSPDGGLVLAWEYDEASDSYQAHAHPTYVLEILNWEDLCAGSEPPSGEPSPREVPVTLQRQEDPVIKNDPQDRTTWQRRARFIAKSTVGAEDYVSPDTVANYCDCYLGSKVGEEESDDALEEDETLEDEADTSGTGYDSSGLEDDTNLEDEEEECCGGSQDESSEPVAEQSGSSETSVQTEQRATKTQTQSVAVEGPGEATEGRGAPVWVVDPATLNVFLKDQPMWYETPVGPDVSIELSYNSQSASASSSTFGRKWLFNYRSSLIESATDQSVTVSLPNGRELRFVRRSDGSYHCAKSPFNVLKKAGEHRFSLQWDKTDYTWIYDAVQSSQDGSASQLVEVRDQWKQALRFLYNDKGDLSTIRDAQGKVTTLRYDEQARVVGIEDPFGRSTSFVYDEAGNLSQATDMGGNRFVYSYTSTADLTRIHSNVGDWTFNIENPDGTKNAAFYPAPGAPMGRNRRVTITDPLGHSEEYFYSAKQHRAWNVDKVHYLGYSAQHNNASGDVFKEQWMVRRNSEGRLRVVQTVSKVATARQVKVATPQQKSAAQPIKARLTSFGETPKSVRDNSATKNASQTNDEALGLTYTSWGAPATQTQKDGTVTRFNYDPNTKQLVSVVTDGVELGRYTYDVVGRVRTEVDARGQMRVYDYDNLNNIIRTTYVDGTFETVTYGFLNRRSSLTNRSGERTTFVYDALGHLREAQNAAGEKIYSNYDANGNVTGLIDAKGQLTAWEYDNSNRVIKKVFANGSFWQIGYDEEGRLASKRDANGNVTRFGYDKAGNLSLIDYPKSSDVHIEYDENNHPVKMTDALGTTRFEFDTDGMQLAEDGPWKDDTVNSEFSDPKHRESLTIGGMDKELWRVSYGYDAQGRTTSIGSAAGVFRLTYDGKSSRPLTLGMANGGKTQWKYDALGQLESIVNKNKVGHLLSQFSYDRDGALIDSKVEQRGSASPRTTKFDYDASNRLIGEKSFDTATSYDYDAAGNLIERRQDSKTLTRHTAWNVNSLNEVEVVKEQRGDTTRQEKMSYDAEGNLVADVDHLYSYDDANRLSKVTTLDTKTGKPKAKSEFVYDGFNRKRIMRHFIWKEGSWKSQGETRFVFDGLTAVQERNGHNGVEASLTFTQSHEGGVGGLLARTVSLTGDTEEAQRVHNSFYNYDGLGNVVQLTGTSGAVTANYSYDAFGRLQGVSGVGANQPYRFNTKFYDSSSGLYDFGFRFYNVGQGRWLNRDPRTEIGGLNLYAFSANNPLLWHDPYGLTPSYFYDLWDAYMNNSFSEGFDDIVFGGAAKRAGTTAGNPNSSNWDKIRDYGLLTVDVVTTATAIVATGGTVAAARIALKEAAVKGGYKAAARLALQAALRAQKAKIAESIAKIKNLSKVGVTLKNKLKCLKVGTSQYNAIREKLLTIRKARQGLEESIAVSQKAAGLRRIGCFVAGTLVWMADGSSKAIEKVRVGEYVLSCDPVTGKVASKRVETLSMTSASATFDVQVGNEIITTTKNHPFFVKGFGFVPAGQISRSDRLQSSSGTLLGARLFHANILHSDVPVYNFTVQDWHTYFVGNNKVWVHNGVGILCKPRLTGEGEFQKAAQLLEDNFIARMWKATDKFPGGTAGAIRRERLKGTVGNREHAEKGKTLLKGLNDIINTGKVREAGTQIYHLVSPDDLEVLRRIRNDLARALNGK